MDAAASDSEGGMSEGVPARHSSDSLTAGQPPLPNGAHTVLDKRFSSSC